MREGARDLPAEDRADDMLDELRYRQIVEALVRNRGKLVTQQQLLQQVWGPQYERETHYLRIYMSQIRRKLEPDPSRPRYFITEPGMGYRFVMEEQ